MLSISRLFEEISSFPLSRKLQKTASKLYMRGTPEYNTIAQRIAEKAKTVSPKYQAMKRKLS
jgi:hypothetical protein